jgi:hypothetical protein
LEVTECELTCLRPSVAVARPPARAGGGAPATILLRSRPLAAGENDARLSLARRVALGPAVLAGVEEALARHENGEADAARLPSSYKGNSDLQLERINVYYNEASGAC